MARLKWAGAGAALVAVAGAVAVPWTHVRMPGPRHRGPLPPVTEAQRDLADALRGHVEALAGDIGPRDVARRPDALVRAAGYVHGAFAEAGYTTASVGFEVGGWPVENVVVEIPGAERPDEIVVIGAHYDTEPGTPGADDNASGVAALLELARRLEDRRLPRTVQWVAFANEEAPYFGSMDQGAMVHAAGLVGRDVTAMLSLESLGYYDETPGSQRYPSPFDLLYPDTGDFVAFIGDLRSRSLVRRSVRVFREAAAFPSEGAAVPGSVPGVGWSDHRAFWEHGWPAVMVTGTAPFRNPHYHQPTDTADRLDYERLARVVEGLEAVVVDLASR